MQAVAGIISPVGGEPNSRKVEAMLATMMHRDGDVKGLFASREAGFCGGWISAAGESTEQIKWNERNDTGVLFCGEHFGEGNENDASHVLSLYEKCGGSFVEKLNGLFSGALIDLQQQKVWIFNDRYGCHRMYYHENADGFYFASEAKAILAVCPELRRLDDRGLAEFLFCGCVLQNRTLFPNVFVLPPASAWLFVDGRATKRQTYFRRELWEEQRALPADEYYEQVKTIWSKNVGRYFRGQQRAGLSLTGGVDSRLILAYAPHNPGELPCITFGGARRDCMDVKVARKVASICQQPHEVIRVNGDFLDRFPSLAEKTIYSSDGGLDVTCAIDLYVQDKIARIAPVRLTGTNGGELLRRIVVFRPKEIAEDVFQEGIAQRIDETADTYATETRGHPLSFVAFKQAPWFLAPKFGLERQRVKLRMPYFDNELVRLLYQAPDEDVQSNGISLRLIEAAKPSLVRVPTDRGICSRSFLSATGLPHLFQEFTFKAEYAFDYGMPQWLAPLNRTFGFLQPDRIFLGRHKIQHFRAYYQGVLANYVKDVLLDSRSLSRPYLRKQRVAHIVNQHVSGARNYTREIHKLITLELIQRQLIERN